MNDLASIPIIAAVLGILIALLGKPSKLALIAAIAGTVLFGAGAVMLLVENSGMDRLARATFYPLETEPDGLHVLRITSIPGVPGLNARPVPKGFRCEFQNFSDRKLPVSNEQIRQCRWRIKTPGVSLHLHDEKCECSPKDYIVDTGFDDRFRDGTFKTLELEYLVDDQTRSTLKSIDLQVGFPFTFGNDLAMGNAFGGIFAMISAAISFLGLVAVGRQFFGLRRRASQPRA